MNIYKISVIILLVICILTFGWYWPTENGTAEQWLHNPTTVKSAETGEPYTRAQLLDMMLASALENSLQEE